MLTREEAKKLAEDVLKRRPRRGYVEAATQLAELVIHEAKAWEELRDDGGAA